MSLPFLKPSNNILSPETKSKVFTAANKALHDPGPGYLPVFTSTTLPSSLPSLIPTLVYLRASVQWSSSPQLLPTWLLHFLCSNVTSSEWAFVISSPPAPLKQPHLAINFYPHALLYVVYSTIFLPEILYIVYLFLSLSVFPTRVLGLIHHY